MEPTPENETMFSGMWRREGRSDLILSDGKKGEHTQLQPQSARTAVLVLGTRSLLPV